MWHRSAALGGFLAQFCLVTAADGLELGYVSHLSLYEPGIGLTEPSGLAIDPDGSGFWIVSDDTPTVFRLEASGEIGAFLGTDDRLRDLEGVATDLDRGRLLVVSERTGSILDIARQPPHRIKAVKVAELSGMETWSDAMSDRDNGLEGITVDPGSGAVFLLKEKAPRLLVEISPDLGKALSIKVLDDLLPDGEDVSGLAVDTERDGFWIASDIGQAVHFLPHDGSSPTAIDLFWQDGDRTRRLKNAEGVALSEDGEMLFVLTDDGKHSRLVQYRILGQP